MSFFDSKYFPLIVVFLIIYTFITIEVVWMQTVKGTDIDTTDYCSMHDDNKTVEYCMIGYHPLDCDDELEQLLCKELARLTGDLEK